MNTARADQDAARELKLFTENDGDLYRQQTTSILKNLVRKKAAGIYKPELAEKLFMYLCESGAKKYARQFGDGEAAWSRMFNKPTRELVASEWRREFDVAFANGEYDQYIPKKYKKTAGANAQLSYSIAYLSGKKDAASWIRSTDPLPRTLKAITNQDPGINSPSQTMVQTVGSKHTAAIAKKLGISASSVRTYDAAFNAAAAEYDAGYLTECRKILGAMEGK